MTEDERNKSMNMVDEAKQGLDDAALERKIADLKSQLDMWRHTHNVGSVVVVEGKTGRYRLKLVTPTKKVWDDDLLAKDGVDLDAYRTTQTGTPYLVVTPEED